MFSRSILLDLAFRGWNVWRRHRVSCAPFDDQRVLGQTVAESLNVLVQGILEFEEYGRHFLVPMRRRDLRAEFTDFIFHTTHGALASSQG